MAWLTAEEFAGSYPPSLSDDVVGIRLDPDLDPLDRPAAIAAEIAQAITAAEDRARTRLLKRGNASSGFSLEELPADPSAAAENLKRLVADLAWFHLHRGFDQVSERVEELRTEALDELREIALCRNFGAVAAALPTADQRGLSITISGAGQRPMTVKNLSEDGYLG